MPASTATIAPQLYSEDILNEKELPAPVPAIPNFNDESWRHVALNESALRARGLIQIGHGAEGIVLCPSGVSANWVVKAPNPNGDKNAYNTGFPGSASIDMPYEIDSFRRVADVMSESPEDSDMLVSTMRLPHLYASGTGFYEQEPYYVMERLDFSQRLIDVPATQTPIEHAQICDASAKMLAGELVGLDLKLDDYLLTTDENGNRQVIKADVGIIVPLGESILTVGPMDTHIDYTTGKTYDTLPERAIQPLDLRKQLSAHMQILLRDHKNSIRAVKDDLGFKTAPGFRFSSLPKESKDYLLCYMQLIDVPDDQLVDAAKQFYSFVAGTEMLRALTSSSQEVLDASAQAVHCERLPRLLEELVRISRNFDLRAEDAIINQAQDAFLNASIYFSREERMRTNALLSETIQRIKATGPTA